MNGTLALCVALSLSARPVARVYRGPLDGLDVKDQSAAVIARFEADVDKPTAQNTVDQVAHLSGLTAVLRADFIRTSAGNLVAFKIQGDGAMPFGRYTTLARVLSERTAVAEAWAFVAPGPRDDSMEGEAWFHFQRGDPVRSVRLQYRDETLYLEHVRRKSPASTWRLSRWPSYPLSELARALGLPGRGCLDQPWQLQTLATVGWPDDAGENLSAVWIDLPGGMATEIQQWALHQKQSTSKVVADALAEARKSSKLAREPESGTHAPYDEGQPDAEKHARRSLTLFLPAAELEHAEESASGQAISLSRAVQYAWRRAHPFAVKR